MPDLLQPAGKSDDPHDALQFLDFLSRMHLADATLTKFSSNQLLSYQIVRIVLIEWLNHQRSLDSVSTILNMIAQI